MTITRPLRSTVLLAVLVSIVAGPALAQKSTALGLYRHAQTLEADARARLGQPGEQTTATLGALRAAIGAYRDVVRYFPKSAYCDNALWLAEEIASDAFKAFRQDADRQTARTLLTQLVREYPASRLAAQARDELARPEEPQAQAVVTIRDIRRRIDGDRVTVDIDLDGEPAFTSAGLADPPRFYVDLANTRALPVLRNAVLNFESGLVKQVRLGQRPNGAIRVVLDAEGVDSCQASLIPRPMHVSISCTPSTQPAAPTTTGRPPLTSRPVVPPAEAGPPVEAAPRPLASRLIGTASRTPMIMAAPIAEPSHFVWPVPEPAPEPVVTPEAPVVTPPPAPVAAPVAPPAAPSVVTPPAAPVAAPVAPPAAAPVVTPPPAPVALPPAPTTDIELLPPVLLAPPKVEPAAEVSALWSLSVEPTMVSNLPDVVPPVLPAVVRASPPRTRDAAASPYAMFSPRTALIGQPAVQVVAASQFTTGDEARIGGQPKVDPDLGIVLFDPGLPFGNLYADVNVTHRDNRAVLGRGVVRLDSVRLAGLSWSLDAGDTWNAPVVQDFGFTNLFAPPVTFEGVSITGESPSTFVLLSGGRVTAQRNIFGTDTQPVGQDMFQALFSHRPNERLDIFAHAAMIRSGNTGSYTALTDRSAGVGAGLRYRVTPDIEMMADYGANRFRRRGSSRDEYASSGLVGSIWSMPHGWAEINVQQFPIGYFPVTNYPYADRSGVFAASEVDLSNRARVFAGGEYSTSDLNRTAAQDATIGVQPGTGARGYGGLRIGVLDSSIVSVRLDSGGRRIEPSNFGPGFQSDTGVFSTEWHSRFRGGNVFARYERRSNVDPENSTSSFTQHDATAQLYLDLRNGRQIFGSALFSRRADRGGDGQTLWQAGGGGQLPVGPLFFRVEGTVGRTLDWTSQEATPRQSLAAGLTGPIAPRTFLSFDCFIDHMPFATGTGSPWVTRTMVRLTRTFPFGSPRAPQYLGAPVRSGPTGRVVGTVFADWNGNGEMDAGEEPVAGITVTAGPFLSVMTGADGHFTLPGVPIGDRVVSIDLASVPADFDTPSEVGRPVSVSRSQPATVAFGMLPLGNFQGVVMQDVDGDGQLGPADTPINGAVLVMDDGGRTEVTRDGRFRFDPVRMGTHTVSILVASLPDGAQINGPSTVTVELARNQTAGTVVFLVKVEKRPEIRKVFPPKK